jgi:hypothetical protein
MESSQSESGKRLKKLTIMAMQAALKILQIRQDRDGLCSMCAYLIFSKQEIEFVERVSQTKYEGKTKLQKTLTRLEH